MAIVIAESGRMSLWRSTAAETVWAEVPSSPAMTQIPITGGFPEHQKETVRSDILDGRAMQGQVLQTGQLGQLTAPFELTFSDFQWAFAAALRSAYTTVAIVAATDIAAVAATDTFTSTTTNFVTAGLSSGCWFRVSGFVNAANNGLFRAGTVTATALPTTATMTSAGVVSTSPALADEAATPSITIAGKYARNGSTLNSYLLEAHIPDIAVPHFESHRGARVSQLDLSVTTQALITGSLQMITERARLATSTVSGGDTVWSGESSLVAGLNVGTILASDALLSNTPQEITLSLNPNIRVDRSIQALTPANLGMGRWGATGTLQTYFESSALRAIFVDHTVSSLLLPLVDSSGNILVLTFPAVHFVTNPVAPRDPDSPLDSPFTWEAQPTGSATTDYMAQVDILQAA